MFRNAILLSKVFVLYIYTRRLFFPFLNLIRNTKRNVCYYKIFRNLQLKKYFILSYFTHQILKKKYLTYQNYQFISCILKVKINH